MSSAALKARWLSLQARERRMILAAASVVLLALLWWLAIAPALKTLQQFDASSRALEQQVQRMQSLRQQAQTLQNQSVGVSPAVAQRNLQNATKELLGEAAQIQVAGDRATVRFQGASPAAFSQWVTQARESARALPVQVEINRSAGQAEPSWSGTVILALSAT